MYKRVVKTAAHEMIFVRPTKERDLWQHPHIAHQRQKIRVKNYAFLRLISKKRLTSPFKKAYIFEVGFEKYTIIWRKIHS